MRAVLPIALVLSLMPLQGCGGPPMPPPDLLVDYRPLMADHDRSGLAPGPFSYSFTAYAFEAAGWDEVALEQAAATDLVGELTRTSGGIEVRKVEAALTLSPVAGVPSARLVTLRGQLPANGSIVIWWGRRFGHVYQAPGYAIPDPSTLLRDQVAVIRAVPNLGFALLTAGACNHLTLANKRHDAEGIPSELLFSVSERLPVDAATRTARLRYAPQTRGEIPEGVGLIVDDLPVTVLHETSFSIALPDALKAAIETEPQSVELSLDLGPQFAGQFNNASKSMECSAAPIHLLFGMSPYEPDAEYLIRLSPAGSVADRVFISR